MNISKTALLQMFAVGVLSASGAEFYEDFHDAPNLSEGWTYGETNNVAFDNYEGTNSTDDKTPLGADKISLKVTKVKGTGDVSAEVLSPVSGEPLLEYSFFCKANGQGENGDVVSVYGRTEESSNWQLLASLAVENFAKHWVTNDIAAAADIRQLKFAVSASAATYKAISLDSLHASSEARQLPSGDDPDDPAEPNQRTDLKIEATAPDRILATWQGVPGEDGYRVELFRSVDSRETEVPDFSGLASGNWPAGWTHSSTNGLESYSDGATRNVKFLYSDAWIVSRPYSKPVTSFSCKFLSHSLKASELANTKLVIETSSSASGDDWVEFEKHPISASTTNLKSGLDYEKNVRRIRFSIFYDGDDRSYRDNLLIEFRVLSVTCGEVVSTSEESRSVAEPATVFSNLNATASYFVTVRPVPSDDPELVATSAVLDLSKEHFRRTGALPVTLRNLTYEERFDSLSNFVSQTKTAKMKLDYWQFVLNGAETDALVLSQTNSASQNAGCYVCRDKARIADIDSAMIGTLASKDSECAVGLALRNDTGRKLRGPKVTFDSVQRSSYANPASYAFEWRISDGESSIAAGLDWRQVSIPRTAPITSEKRTVVPGCRERNIVVEIPAKVPAGKVLLIRWRHPKTTSGPMMAIDNVRIAFAKPGGFSLSIK